jgi:glycosyltransferase involved in cell wall biosynthesis
MSRRTLRILFVTAVYPHAPEYGAQQRVLNICRLLSQIGKVSIVMVATEPIDQISLAKTSNEFDIAHVALIQTAPLANLVERVRFEVDPDWMNTYFTSIREADREILLKLIDRHDLVWVHTLRTANECRIYKWPHTVLDIDDIPSRVYRSKTQIDSTIVRIVESREGVSPPRAPRIDSTIVRKLLDHRMVFTWRRRERRVARRFDVTVVCSESDRAYLCNIPRRHVIPNGYVLPNEQPDRVYSVPPRVGFIGRFRGPANVDGVRWFIQNVWPLVKRRIPEARLRLVGGDSDRDFPKAGQDVDGLGYIADPGGEIATWSAMIVPIRVGGGSRVKIAQAFSRKCPVVSTSLGAFGYDVINGEEILIADDPQSFSAACIKLIQDAQFGTTIAENAWSKFLKNWTWNSMGYALKSAVEECLASNRDYDAVSQFHNSSKRRINSLR